jgi:hypothetical protein
MARNHSSDLSDLEREIELEMESELEAVDVGAQESEGPEYENDDREAADTWELEAESDEEADDESFRDEEADDGSELEIDGGDRNQEYVERFMEIASRQYESESEVDQAMNETLDDMAREYFFGKILKKAKKLASNPAIRALVKKGLKVASGQLPALKAAMALAKGDLKGSILNLGKQALGAAIPGGPAVLGALSSLGFKEVDDPQANREAWENYVEMSREAFEHLANNVTPSADQPLEASRLATNAYRHAIRRAQNRTHLQRRGNGGMAMSRHRRPGGPVVRHHLRPGQKIVITGAAKLIVKGA